LVVSNSSPLVYLAAPGDFELLRDLFHGIVIPQAVFDEVVMGGAGFPVAHAVRNAAGSWLSVQAIGNAPEADRLRVAGLHPGESETVVLATGLRSHALFD